LVNIPSLQSWKSPWRWKLWQILVILRDAKHKYFSFKACQRSIGRHQWSKDKWRNLGFPWFLDMFLIGYSNCWMINGGFYSFLDVWTHFSVYIPRHLRRENIIWEDIPRHFVVNLIVVIACLSLVSIFLLSRNKWLYHKQKNSWNYKKK